MTDNMQRIVSGDFGSDVLQKGIADLKAWRCGYLAWRALDEIPYDRLFKSTMHGAPHVERVVLLGAMCAMRQDADQQQTWLALEGCVYHDVGRRSDNYDNGHGTRSAELLPKLVSYTGDELRMIQTAVATHSQRDFRDAVREYDPQDIELTRFVCRIVRDADRLDFVRFAGVDPSFLQFDTDKDVIPFAQALVDAYFAK